MDNCNLPASGGVENAHGKVNVLLQTYISRGFVDSFSLVSDLAYVAQVHESIPLTTFKLKEELRFYSFVCRPVTRDCFKSLEEKKLCKTKDKDRITT